MQRYYEAVDAYQHPNTVCPTSNPSRNRRQGKSPGFVRIIAGQWRGRRLPVPELNGLRPTGDRVRETVFNWLQPYIAGRHCLDLFAGTGALGFESLSRLAASVTFIEPHPMAFRHLCDSAALLGVPSSNLVQTTADHFLSRNQQRFDLVFVDPPFDQMIQWQILDSLAPSHLAPGALVYVESPVRQPLPANWPAGCEIHKEKVFGEVCSRIFRFYPTST